MLIIISILSASIFILVGVWLLWNSGKQIPFVDENGKPLKGSISEKIYVDIVVWWERRGSGISFSADLPREMMTLEQAISDTSEGRNYLRNRFHQEIIYLMGHSGGTIISIQAAAQAAELYHAYIGVAQMSNQLQSERLAYEYMLQQFKENGNRTMKE